MKKFLLLPLLLGLPSPLFAAQESTSGYKTTAQCTPVTNGSKESVSLMKKEDANSRKWGVYTCADSGSCSWADKAVSYDTAKDKYNDKSTKLPCFYGDVSID